jgi:uncharacterized protein DUF6328
VALEEHQPGSQPGARSAEEQEKLDRQLQELLNEMRVAMPGVQVLFAFLLAVPFQQGFKDITDSQRIIYFGTLIAAAIATAFLIAPTAYHRIVFQHGHRPDVIRLGTRQFIIGLVALAAAMNGAVALVTDLVFSGETLVVTVVLTVSLFGWLWFGIGLMHRLRGTVQ